MCCEECIRMHWIVLRSSNGSIAPMGWHNLGGKAVRISFIQVLLGVPHHAKMRRCGGSRWDTATHLLLEQSQKQHRSKLVRLPLRRTVLHRCFLFGLCLATSHGNYRASFTTVSWEFHVYVLHSVSCDVLWDLALRRRRLLWQSALQPQSRPWRVTAACHSTFPCWLWMMAQGLGGTYYPETNGCSPLFIIWLLTVVHHFPTFSLWNIAMLGYSQFSDTPMWAPGASKRPALGFNGPSASGWVRLAASNLNGPNRNIRNCNRIRNSSKNALNARDIGGPIERGPIREWGQNT